ncbi:MAG: DM13 domain-containing protein [Pseudomonadota bacterium]
MKKALIVIAAVAALAIGWFLVSPLFIDRTVDEAFTYMEADGSVNVDAVMSMPEGERNAAMNEIMQSAAAAPEQQASDDMPDQLPQVLATGQFRDADAVHKGSGDATLYELADGRHLIRFEDFRTTNGPDLVVYLARHASPTTADDVTDGGYISLGKLKGNVGNQNYVVPANIDTAEYKSVVVWCELFGVLFSPAPLMPVAREPDTHAS